MQASVIRVAPEVTAIRRIVQLDVPFQPLRPACSCGSSPRSSRPSASKPLIGVGGKWESEGAPMTSEQRSWSSSRQQNLSAPVRILTNRGLTPGRVAAWSIRRRFTIPLASNRRQAVVGAQPYFNHRLSAFFCGTGTVNHVYRACPRKKDQLP
jgi:hypothetical protein